MHQIFNSIEEDNFQLFSDLINQHPEYLNEIDKDGWSLLSLVTHYEMPEFVQFLLEQMTSEQINSQTPYHPLFIAFENNSSLVDILIKDPKIDLTIISKSGDNLLYYADYFQRTDLSPYIINAGVSPFAVNKTEQSAILYAIEHGNQNLFDLYTQNPDFSSYYEESWVKKAIKHNQVFIFKQLQPHSNLSSDELFNLAIGFEHIQIADLVLDNGDLIPGQQQVTAIVELMCKKYDNNEDQTAALRLADYLFNTKVPFNKFINSQGQSAWMLAVYNDNETIFEKLINCSNETVNISDNEQHTPLFYAIEKHNLNFVTSILARGANVNHVDNNKNTPLIQAVRYGLDDIVLAILKYPTVLVNEVNSNHDTALSLALQHKKIDIVSALIWAGGEITKNPVKFIEETSI
jgi:ankyrin repeat protein